MEGYKKHRLYTALLLEGLQGAASNDSSISLYELVLYLEKTMPQISERFFNVRLTPQNYTPTNFDLVATRN